MSLVQLSERVHRFEDTCAVYVLTSGERAVLVDLGGGAVLDAVGELGVQKIDWVLFTHHHRDQCSGHRLLPRDARIAAPAREVHAFADVERFWQTAPVYDQYDCTGLHNVVAQDVRVDLALEDGGVLEWEDLRIETLPAPGHTKGSVSYAVEVDGLVFAFTGDLIHSSGKVWTVHDLNWWYGGVEGYRSALTSAAAVRRRMPDRLAPSHGELIDDPTPALAALEESLLTHLRCITRPALPGPPADEFVTGRFELIGESLVAVTHTCANFYVLLGDSGEALFFDYGFAGEHHFKAGFRFVEHSLDILRERFGVRRPAVVVPTHYHDDHVAGIGFLRQHFDTEVWAYDGFADLLERPWRYRVPCLWPEPARISRRIQDGDTIEWGGARLEVHRAPGHTWYAAAFLGEVGGCRVAVAGDAVAQDLNGGLWGGGPVYRNRVGIGDFSTTADVLLEYEPELLLTGHRGVVPVSRSDLEGFASWAREYSKTVARLLPDPSSAAFQLDPDLVRVLPYQAEGRPGEPVDLEVEVRNPFGAAVDAAVRLVLPDGWSAEPEAGGARVDPDDSGRILFSVLAPRGAARDVRHVVLADVTLGSRRLGQTAESLVILRSE